MTIQASAPCRLDFAGGWTDVAPFSLERGGTVVNAAIELRAAVTVELGGDHHRIESDDLGMSLELRRPGDLVADGRLDLLKAAIRFSAVPNCRLTSRSDAPAGSGLGSSGALDVALVAALDQVAGRRSTPTELAERAWHLEAVEAGLPGGRQDQYSAALGGFHRFDFDRSGVSAAPLRLESGFVEWLERQTVICYTGQSRVSGDTIARVMSRYRAGDRPVVAALEGLAETAVAMAAALEAADAQAVGRLLSANWAHQQALDPGMSTPLMARLEATMLDGGALGGKAAGAGAGGSMFFLVPGSVDRAVAAARHLGVTVLPFTWSTQGVRVW